MWSQRPCPRLETAAGGPYLEYLDWASALIMSHVSYALNLLKHDMATFLTIY